MNQFFIGIILVLSLGCYWLYTENATLKDNNAQLEMGIATQEKTIESLKNDFALQGEALGALQAKNNEIELEMNRYLDIFKRHNLTKLAAAKPGLIESRVNKATKEVFDGIENDSRDIDDLDDGLQLQSPPNEDIRG
jgi:uncharacterized coiled-coil protein SlyX|tara:strand:- start:60 stop:470 length:411 start_codon:yes stop_codon:yes gene_type:complete